MNQESTTRLQERTLSGAEILFQSVKIGSLELKNRVVMAPMTRAMSPGRAMIANPTGLAKYGKVLN